MLVTWNFIRHMLGLTCGFSICFVVEVEPYGFVLTLDKIGELLCFLGEYFVKFVNGQT